jgi:hypothetical protein
MGFSFLKKLFLLGMAHTVCWPVKTNEVLTKKDWGRCLERTACCVRCSKEKVTVAPSVDTGVASDACLSTIIRRDNEILRSDTPVYLLLYLLLYRLLYVSAVVTADATVVLLR